MNNTEPILSNVHTDQIFRDKLWNIKVRKLKPELIKALVDSIERGKLKLKNYDTCNRLEG